MYFLATVVRVVLDANQIQAGGIGYLGQGECELYIFDRGVRTDAEEGWVEGCICHELAPDNVWFKKIG
jgi:hypothetical protein